MVTVTVDACHDTLLQIHTMYNAKSEPGYKTMDLGES